MHLAVARRAVLDDLAAPAEPQAAALGEGIAQGHGQTTRRGLARIADAVGNQDEAAGGAHVTGPLCRARRVTWVSSIGPLCDSRTSVNALPLEVCASKAWGRPAPGCGCDALLRRVRCGTRPGVAPQNSLHSLRSLRSDSCGESVHEAREYARRPQGCVPRRRRRSPVPAGPKPCGNDRSWGRVSGNARASSPRVAARRRRATGRGPGSMPGFGPSPTRTGAASQSCGWVCAGRACAAARRRARRGTVQWTIPAWRAAGRLRPARPARRGFRWRAYSRAS